MTTNASARMAPTSYDLGGGRSLEPRASVSRRNADHARRAFVEQMMGLPVSVHVRGPAAQQDTVADLVERAFDALRADDQMFSPYRADSAVSRIRRGELTLADAPARVRRAAHLCDEAAARTGGSFSAWLPDRDGTPRFDPSGLVKGWAVEQAFDRLNDQLHELGPHDALVCAGGDIAVRSERTDTPDWVIGVEDPADRSRLLMRVPLRTGSVATSGSAARGRHIIDPVTMTPAADLLSVTVVGPSLTWADVYATAAFVRGHRAADFISSLARHEAVLVHADHRQQVVVGPAR
jgi:FAD:protein FMN transferase